MSVIRKTPYIETIMAAMTDSNLKDLREILNSGGDNVKLSFATLNAATYKNKVTPVYFDFEDGKMKTAILIWTNSYCTLICYHRFQDLMLIELNPNNHTYEKINEDCDINELRRILDDTIQAKGIIESGGAAENTVLTADGNGGTSWKYPTDTIKQEDVDEGDAVKLFGFNENGDLVADDIPEGILVDQTVIEDSENAVAGGGVYDFVENEIEGAKAAVLSDVEAEYAKTSDVENGSIVAGKALAAKNLEPVSDASGSTQTAPFINQGTATNNNDSQASVDTGTLGQQIEKQGNTVVVNQQNNILSPDASYGFTFVKDVNGYIKINGTATQNNNKILNNQLITTHKYLFYSTQEFPIGFSLGITYNADRRKAYIDYPVIVENIGCLYFAFLTNTVMNNFETYILAFDLTQWFGSTDNIPTDLLANPDNFFRYYQGSLAYNAGQLVNSNGRYLVNGKQNVLNPSATYNLVIPNREYNYKGSSTTTITYYDKDKNSLGTESVSNGSQFTTPENCIYIASSVTSATVSLYYEGEDYSEYVPYVEPKVYDTGNEELLSAGNVKDIKKPDGTITRYVGSVDLGTLNWTYGSDRFYADLNTKLVDVSVIPNFLSSIYRPTSYNGRGADKTIYQVTTNQIAIFDSNYTDATAFKTAMSGVYLFYELATPTTSQGTPFSENMDINDMGNMAWYSAYTDENTNTLVSVPQGCKIFYPAWYAGFIDTLGQREDIDWAAEQVVSQAQLGVVANTIGAKLPECPVDTDGTYVLKATVSSGVVTYEWVLEE